MKPYYDIFSVQTYNISEVYISWIAAIYIVIHCFAATFRIHWFVLCVPLRDVIIRNMFLVWSDLQPYAQYDTIFANG